MHKSQRNLAVIAARATASTPNDIAMLRPIVTVHGTGPIRRSVAVRMTATQRNSQGKRSEWNDSTDFFTDPKWDRTCTG